MTIEEIKQKIIPIAKEYDLPKVAVFGSAAVGKLTKNSDIDFLIERSDKISGIDFFGFCLALEDALGKSVDVLTYKGIQNSVFKESILEDEVVIYEK
ncbi:MAG: nucleotidyltransferase domain-containing protein [Defluviitaleaceae bacterium]|nr:nucleotidyltransferase domain-containing protein [Defluviitaleaceae bacterium]